MDSTNHFNNHIMVVPEAYRNHHSYMHMQLYCLNSRTSKQTEKIHNLQQTTGRRQAVSVCDLSATYRQERQSHTLIRKQYVHNPFFTTIKHYEFKEILINKVLYEILVKRAWVYQFTQKCDSRGKQILPILRFRKYRINR